MSTAASPTLHEPFALPEEERSAGVDEDARYRALLARLSHQSVVKRYEAYRDIPWEDPDYAIDPGDPRFELPEAEPLGASDWYRSQPQPVRARMGLHMFATDMKLGLEFENVLKRGLLEFALQLPNGSPEFRYAYHEIGEEVQHALAFQEFVNRTGFDIPGMPGWMRFGSRRVVGFARSFPELFFLFVLGGEDPIDFVQREDLKQNGAMHPLIRRMQQIHVTEEARHLSFARAYLRRTVPRLSRLKLHLLRGRAPVLLGVMAGQMMEPSPQVVREYGIPRPVLLRAYKENPAHHRNVVESLRKVRELCVELDIATPTYTWLWRRMRIWEAV